MQKIAILDIDSTLADNGHRAHLVECEAGLRDWKAFLEPDLVARDRPMVGTQRALKFLESYGLTFFFVTGRHDWLRFTTLEWLDQHYCHVGVLPRNLYMRSIGDQRPASAVKSDLLTQVMSRFLSKPFALAFDDDPHIHAVYHR